MEATPADNTKEQNSAEFLKHNGYDCIPQETAAGWQILMLSGPKKKRHSVQTPAYDTELQAWDAAVHHAKYKTWPRENTQQMIPRFEYDCGHCKLAWQCGPGCMCWKGPEIKPPTEKQRPMRVKSLARYIANRTIYDEELSEYFSIEGIARNAVYIYSRSLLDDLVQAQGTTDAGKRRKIIRLLLIRRELDRFGKMYNMNTKWHQETHVRLNNELDIYPVNQRYHDLKNNKRGNTGNVLRFVERFFKKERRDIEIEN
jgi:hypothetical protein